MLASKAEWLYRQPPRQYKLNQEGRCSFHRWWEQHQQEALAPTTHAVVSAMLGKASAHALRLAAMLHMVWSSDELVSAEVMVMAMAVVDQLINETKAFYTAPPQESTVLMQHIPSINGDVTWRRCTDKGNRMIRAMKSSDFAAAAEQWVEAGLGSIVERKPSIVFRAGSTGMS